MLYVDVSEHSVNRILFLFAMSVKMEPPECCETSTHKIQTPGNYPKDRIRHSEHGESLKSRMYQIYAYLYIA